MIQFTLYSRSWCHLCEDMLSALQACTLPPGARIEVIDVDADPSLVERYDELVPVLTGQKPAQDPVQICHYFLDRDALERFLEPAPG